MEDDTLRQALKTLHEAAWAWSLVCCDRDAHEAQEVLQSVYLKIVEGAARFDGRSSLKTWLFGVIRLTAHEARRRRRRQLTLLRRWFEGSQAAVTLSPSREQDAADGLERLQRDAQIEAALAQLSARQRQIIELVFYHDLTIEQASQIMGVPVGTARTHYARAKQRLAQSLSLLRPLAEAHP